MRVLPTALVVCALVASGVSCSENASSLSGGGAPGDDSAGSGSDGTGDGGTDTPAASTTDERDGTPEGACVYRINEYRKTVDLPRLHRDKSQEACTSDEAESDSSSTKAHGAFGSCSEQAQNECPGWPAPPEKMIDGCLEMMWGEGPGGGHYDNMTNASYKFVSCGFYVTPDSKVWAIQNFHR